MPPRCCCRRHCRRRCSPGSSHAAAAAAAAAAVDPRTRQPPVTTCREPESCRRVYAPLTSFPPRYKTTPSMVTIVVSAAPSDGLVKHIEEELRSSSTH